MITTIGMQNKRHNITMKQPIHNKGMVLLIAILVVGVVSAIGASLLNVTLKQYQLAGISRASEMAFHAANSGMECAKYYDRYDTAAGDTSTYVPFNAFEIGDNEGSITCMDYSGNNSIGLGLADSGDDQAFEFEWGAGGSEVCTKLSVYKFYEDPAADGDAIGPSLMVGTTDLRPSAPCPEGATCTVVVSRGYNNRCNNLNNAKTVERELTAIY